MAIPVGKLRQQKEWLAEISKKFWLIKKRPWVFWFAVTLGSIILWVVLGGPVTLVSMYFYTGNLLDDRGDPLDLDKINKGAFKIASYVLDGREKIIGRFFCEVRDPISFQKIPDLLVKGFLAAEDQRFFRSPLFHWGIDPGAMVRAGFFNTMHYLGFKYGPKSGASGIPQQVARLTYAEEVASFRNRTQTIPRKIFEAQMAIQLVKRYSRETIMATFLNQIYFGHGVNGIVEAGRYYFSKDIRREILTPREVAILVSLNKSSKKYCPIFHQPPKPPDGAGPTEMSVYAVDLAKEQVRLTLARGRYNWVLERVFDEKYLSEDEYREALFKKEEPLVLATLKITPFKNDLFGYSNRMIKEMLLAQGYKDEEITSSRGLRIKTSFDSRIQEIFNEEVNKQLAVLNSELAPGQEKLEGAFVVIENKTGQVVALSGGHDFSETQYNRALALRSPGSAFKPIVFATAFEFGGKTFEDKICNCPFSMQGANGKRWRPKNFQEDNPVPLGYRFLPEILIRSVNLGTLNLARGMMGDVIKTAHLVGIWGEQGIFRDPDGQIWFKTLGAGSHEEEGLDPRLPTALGASGVSLLELTNAYAVFARGGIYLKPTMILEIKDAHGEILYRLKPVEGQRVLSEETARKITILLRAVTKVGTAKISMRNIEQQVAVKTGTSNGPDDLLMAGFTPEYSIGIRVGYDRPKPIELPRYMARVSGREGLPVSGGWTVGPIFRATSDRFYAKRRKVEFSPEVEQGLRELLEKYH